MTEPGIALWRLGGSLTAGMVLGLWYGFLRPLRPRFTGFSDLLFVLGATAAWLWGFSWAGSSGREPPGS